MRYLLIIVLVWGCAQQVKPKPKQQVQKQDTMVWLSAGKVQFWPESTTKPSGGFSYQITSNGIIIWASPSYKECDSIPWPSIRYGKDGHPIGIKYTHE